MLNSILRFFRSGAVAPKTSRNHNTTAAPSKPVAAGVPIYPPVDQGVSLGKADAVIATQTEMIRRLKLLAGLSSPEFELLYGDVLRSLARQIDLLPASESGTHMGAGGLFRLALEIGFFSRQASEAVIFAGRAGVELRRGLEPRWRYATFLAGLCCELHRPLSQMIVVAENGEAWPVHRMGLAEWLESIGATRYFIRWVKEGGSFAGGAATFLATKIIPEASLQYLQEGHPSIIPAMLEAMMADSASKENQIAEIVGRIRRKVFERDQVLAPQNYGKLTVGSQLEPHLIDAMRQLVANGTWTINVKKSRIWFGKDGMYIVWRTAAKEIIEVLDRIAVSGIPRDPTTIAEVLLRAGVLAADKSGDLYWKIKPPTSNDEYVAVRLANPSTLLVAIEDNLPGALDIQLSVGGNPDPSRQPPMGGGISTPPVVPSIIAPPVPAEAMPAVSAQESAAADLLPPASAPDPANSSPKQPKLKPLAEELQPGAITPVQESMAPALPEDVAQRMTTLVREAVAQIVTDYREGRLEETSSLSNDGLAISLEQMGSYGADLTKVITELHGLGWLWVDAANPKRKIHMAQIRGKSVQSAIFKRQVAQDLGFLV